MLYLDQERVMLKYLLPLSEIVVDFLRPSQVFIIWLCKVAIIIKIV